MATNKPFFVPQKEIDLIDAMNEELIDEIVGQTVDIYKISIDDTDENIYGESSNLVIFLIFICSTAILFTNVITISI